MKSNPLRHILEIAKDKEVPRQFIVNDLEALVKELEEEIASLDRDIADHEHVRGFTRYGKGLYDKMKEILGDA